MRKGGSAGKDAPPQKLALAFSTADVVILGWRLGRLADSLRENKLAAIGILPKRYADLDRNKPFVASITITPIAKTWETETITPIAKTWETETGQSSLLTLWPSFHCRCQTVRHMRPASHVQPLRDPFQRHKAFPPQVQRYLHLLRITLALILVA